MSCADVPEKQVSTEARVATG
ncbi:hypothetical protein RSAG8_04975, partial [Rhizoctonia solani AG-8 WAC10335]